MGKENTTGFPKNMVLPDYPSMYTEFEKKEDREFFDLEEWMSDIDDMWRKMAAIGIVSASSKKFARYFCKQDIRAARNYAREGNVKKAERCIERLEMVYPVATGEPLSKKTVTNIRRKYPK